MFSRSDYIVDLPDLLFTAQNGNRLLYEPRKSRLPPQWRDDRPYVICDPLGYGISAFHTYRAALKAVHLYARGTYPLLWGPGMTSLPPTPPLNF